MSTLRLHRGTAPRPLAEAVRAFAAAFPSEPLCGLLYAPDACRLVRLEADGRAYRPTPVTAAEIADKRAPRPDAGEVPSAALEQVFEARLFGPTAELRWLRREHGDGDCVVLSERSDLQGLSGLELDAGTDHGERLDGGVGAYLLWGRAAADAEQGWQLLTDRRIGGLWAPVPPDDAAEPGWYLYVGVREYRRIDRDADGNAYVSAEVLHGIGASHGRD